MRRRTLQWCVISLLLTSCGGGQDNRPPAASAQSLTTAEDTIATGTLLGVDPDNDLLTYSIASQAAHGTASVQASGAFQYQPSANFNGSDSFEFQVTDPSGASAQAAVSITVTPVNDPPTLPPATFNGVQNQDITGKAAGSDVDGDTLMYAVAANPAHGTLVSFDSQGNFTYRPNAGYHGSDSFSASVTDPSGASNTGVLTLRVDGPPQANNDLISVPAGGPAVVDVLANDADPESDPLTVQIVASPTTGTASVTADNRVSLSLPNGFRGFTRFSYRAMDPNGLSSTATAVVFVGTPVARLAWIGDEFTPGTSDIVVSDFIGTSAADAPLPPGDTLSPFSVLYRPDSDQPAVGFSTSLGGTYWATLDKPGSAKLITSGAQVTDIDVHSRFALYQSGDLLSLAALDGSAGTAVLNPPNYCGGAFGPAGADVFLGCTPPVNSFTPSTAYWLQVAAPGVVTPLAPATDPSNGPNAPIITPDGRCDRLRRHTNRLLRYLPRSFHGQDQRAGPGNPDQLAIHDTERGCRGQSALHPGRQKNDLQRLLDVQPGILRPVCIRSGERRHAGPDQRSACERVLPHPVRHLAGLTTSALCASTPRTTDTGSAL
jgi:VCBS repeat-containing protein